MVRDLLAKFLLAEAGPREDRLHVFSAHCVEGDKGRFYIESRKESHVRTALASIPFVRLNMPFKLLRRPEMPRVVVAPLKVELQEGQWVRVKNGLYRDDLAQVWSRSEVSDRIFVRIVPRISKEQYQGAPAGGKRGRSQRSSIRPMAGPFRPELVEDKTTIMVIGEGTTVSNAGDGDENGGISDEVEWQGMRFKMGLLVKEFRISGLHTVNVTPNQDEISRFKRSVSSFKKSLQAKMGGSIAGGAAASSESSQQANLSLADNELDNFEGAVSADGTKPKNSKVQVFIKGDHVQVTRGEYVSVTGIVVSATSLNIELRPDDPAAVLGKKLITVPTNLIRKYFAPGVHVKILAGLYSGETGTITSVQGDQATIYSDVVHKEIHANMSDLQFAFSTGTGNTTLGSYHLFDLVQIGESVGVIVDVEREGFQILGENGQSKYVPLAEVGQRRNVSRASVFDAHNHNVNLGETVRILEGPWKDVTGILKHTVKSTVFIQCPNATVRENRGLVCLRRHHIASVIDRSVAPGAAAANNFGGGGSMGPPTSRPTTNARRIDPSVSRKEVTVIRGQWKGYRGIIKGASEREYTILLTTGSRTVKVSKEDVKAADAVGGGNNNNDRNSSWNAGSNGSAFNGSQTPMRMQTPSHTSTSGDYGFDGYGGGSNMADEFDPNYKPSVAAMSANSYGSGSGSAMDISSSGSSGFAVPQTPGFGLASVPFTPGGPSAGGGYVPTTPGASLVPMTPGGVPQTPGAGFAVPQTPGGYGAIPQTPGAGSFAVPQTPNMMGVPQTPGAGLLPPVTPGGYGAPPMTPGGIAVPTTPGGVPQTPGGAPSTPAPPAPATGDAVWCQAGFEVYDTTSNQTPPPRYVIITPMLSTPLVKVEALTPEGTRSGVLSNITRSSLKLVPLTKKDTVKVISTGKIAQLIGVDDQEQIGVAKLGSEIKVLSLTEFAKFHEL